MDIDPWALAQLRAALWGEPEDDLDDRLISAMMRACAEGQPRLVNVDRERAEFDAIGQRPRGFFPDGTRVSESFKRAVHDQYREKQDEMRDAWDGRPSRRPVMASAAGDESLFVQYVFGVG